MVSMIVRASIALIGCRAEPAESGTSESTDGATTSASTTSGIPGGSSGASEAGATACMPGELRECECMDGGIGSQVCIVDGSGFYPCFCGETDATGIDPSVDESSTAASDPTGDGTSSGTGPIGAVPTVGIQHPSDGETRTVGLSIPFDGNAIDVEDGVLMDAVLVWSSDLDGELGTGASISAPLDTAGMHEVTLSATDSDGNVGTASITLIMQQ
jgi:hypothetical protein